MYKAFRAIYRGFDRTILRRLPSRMEWWFSAIIFNGAKLILGSRLKARTVGEFVAGAHSVRLGGRLPAWAQAELQSLAGLEGDLLPLGRGGQAVGEYIIPWDSVLAGKAYFRLLKQASGTFDAILLIGSSFSEAALKCFAANDKRRLLILDLDGVVAPVGEAHCSVAVLPRRNLAEDECVAVVTRLLIQMAPAEILFTGHPVADTCFRKHGKALQQASLLVRLSPEGRRYFDVEGAGPQEQAPDGIFRDR
ncbi:hypothetical protein [Dyella japonica]|uniref:Uncharacterized protein n=1 Tax=Dyella japonica A8 TaxID=1217721 RepID=A0A075K581_9GAMM|nr:hypothetical protein [Dyella japonica]AIF49381.1 hypothetical protein HY57_20025 [Dyella japonica A8]